MPENENHFPLLQNNNKKKTNLTNHTEHGNIND